MLGNVQSSSMLLTGNSRGIAVKFGINTAENGNFNATLVVFISNFAATHVITSINKVYFLNANYTSI